MIDTGPSREESSAEELRPVEEERARRLNPHKRPRNAEVDNTKRQWDSSIGDFRDNAEGHPPEWDHSDGAGRQRDPELWKHLEELRSG